MLVVKNLSKSYSNRQVVDHVSFAVEDGQIIGLLGKNGAGKTTTFRMTMGMIRADQGQVFFKGEEISSLPMYQRARRGMGYLPQESSAPGADRHHRAGHHTARQDNHQSGRDRLHVRTIPVSDGQVGQREAWDWKPH